MAFARRLLFVASLCSENGLALAFEEDPSSCHVGAVASKASASLLQKASLREEKHAMTLERSPCTGVEAQGKCWYLSDFGEACATTCAKQGFNFSYVVANNTDPITPKLMNWTEPIDLPLVTSGMRQPFAPLECLGRDKVHFHLASADAALNFIGDMSAWKHESCQLACPCGEAKADQCGWKQPPACASQFEWKGVMYSGCPTVDHDGPWCMHHHQHTGKDDFDDSDWSYCTYSCTPEFNTYATESGCYWKPAPSCTPEFNYEGIRYLGCTSAEHHTPWCSNSDPYAGSWNHCQYVCDDQDVSNDKLNTDKDKEVCYWKPDPKCSSSFSYKGTDYTNKCTNEDNPTPWCSLDRIHNGLWTECTRVCTVASETTPAPPPTSTTIVVSTTISPTAPPTAPPTTPPLPVVETTTTTMERVIDHSKLNPIDIWKGSPCERHPESENDYLGLEATLDEEGYQICTVADSPINMKRFVCRVVDKIGCKVVDYSALVGFVPYYSGAATEQSYQHLEDELKILCHAGGKWVVPLTPEDAESN